MKRLTFAFYNLAPAGDPQRGPFFVERELRALANLPRRPWRRRRKVIGVSEAIYRRLPQLPGYRLIRSRETRSRENVALYVLDRLKVGRIEWIDHEETWPRPLHPGRHEPRSTLVVEVEDWTVVVSHAPQVGRLIALARNEWLNILADLLRSKAHRVRGEVHPVVALTDPNALGPALVRRVPGTVSGGTAVEAVHGNGITLTEVHTPGEVNGVPMLSDHKRALIGTAVRRP